MNFSLKNGTMVQIEPCAVRDAEHIVAYLRQIALDTKNLMREPEEVTMTLDDEIKFIEKVQKSSNNCMYCVWDKRKLISVTGFNGIELKRARHKASLGISVLPEYQNQGLGYKLMSVLVDTAKERGLHRLELDVRVDNPDAIYIYEKAGFVKEGIKKDAFFIDGQYVDLQMMAIILEENL